MAKRKIIKIDAEKCNGCGLCIPNCHEGAIQIIDKKARLVSDSFCDGLGACLGYCPQGAISMEEREAEEFDQKKTRENIVKHLHSPSSCPGSKVMDFRQTHDAGGGKRGITKEPSQLKTWPVQIMLIPPNAAYLKDADLLIAADCVAFAYADFHQDLLKDKVLLVGCPKLDDIALYQEKLTQILKSNNIKSITCAHMEVPCCFGLVNMVKSAISSSSKDIQLKDVTISIKGERSG